MSFIDFIRHDLNHRIGQSYSSKGRNRGPIGRPTCMYNLPHLCDVQDYLHEIDLQELQEVHCVIDSTPVADYLTEFQEFAEYLMEEDGLQPPSNPSEALNLYTYLLKKK